MASRIRVGIVLSVATLLIASLAASVSADAGPARANAAAGVTTIGGPPVVGYGAIVRLSGTATPPGSAVTVFFHKQGSVGFTARRHLTSNGAGNYSTTYVADASYRYYALANGTASRIGLTQLATATCTNSGPIIRTLPFTTLPLGVPFAALQVSDGHGRFAGYAFDSRHGFALISWKAGHPLNVVGRVSIPFSSAVRSVHVDAVTSSGSVVADIQPSGSTDTFRRDAFVFAGGKRFQLAHARNWASTVPIGVTAAGIIAEVRVGAIAAFATRRYYVVSWAGSQAPYKVLISNGNTDPLARVTANGDVAFIRPGSQSALVRRPSGTVFPWGPSRASRRLFRWTEAMEPPSTDRSASRARLSSPDGTWPTFQRRGWFRRSS